MSNSLLRLPGPAVTLFIVASCLAIGWNAGRAPLQVKLANLQAIHAKEKQTAAEEAKTLLEAANKRGDELSGKLLTAESQITKLSKEKRYAITQVTVGRVCFDEFALRVLDDAPGLSVSELPKANGSTAAAGGRIATDTDIGRWAIDAGQQYKTCKGRLDTLIDWHATQPSPP